MSADLITRLQAEVVKLPQLEVETQHYHADGMYCRVLPRPKGALIVGKVHKKEHFYMVMSGAVRITNGDGAVRDVYAPAVLVCKPGTKRAVFALMDSVCATVHRTRKTTLENIEADLVEDDSRGMYLPGNVLKPKAIK